MTVDIWFVPGNIAFTDIL